MDCKHLSVQYRLLHHGGSYPASWTCEECNTTVAIEWKPELHWLKPDTPIVCCGCGHCGTKETTTLNSICLCTCHKPEPQCDHAEHTIRTSCTGCGLSVENKERDCNFRKQGMMCSCRICRPQVHMPFVSDCCLNCSKLRSRPQFASPHV